MGYKKTTILLLFVLFNNIVFSQIVVDRSKIPIQNVNIIAMKSRNLIGLTNLDGAISFKPIIVVDLHDTIELQHVSYVTKKIIKSNYDFNDTIILEQQQYTINEVVINAKPKKYQKIEGCFRNTVLVDSSPLYYIDGNINYLTKKSIDYKISLKEYRAFDNKQIIDKVNNYSTGIPINKAYIPIPEEKYLPSIFISKYNLILEPIDSFKTKIHTREGIIIGTIEQQSDFIKYEIKNIFDMKKRKFLNTEIDLVDFNISMIFDSKGLKKLNLIENFDNLQYLTIDYTYTLKHDKEKVLKTIKTREEIFVENTSYSNFVDLEYTRNRGMPHKSSFTNQFWKKCRCDNYYQIDSKMLDNLHMR